MAQTVTPKATGEYKVGTTVFSIWDRSRKEKLGPEAGTRDRRILVRLYYPVLPEAVEGCPEAVLLSQNKLKAIFRTFNLPGKVDGDATEEFYQDVPAVPGRKFPLIVYSHGLGAYAEANNYLCMELCSHGYVVASVGHPYEGMITEFDDGTTLKMAKGIAVYEPYWGGVFKLMKLLRNHKGTWQEQYDRFNEFQSKYCRFLSELVKERRKDVTAVTDELMIRFPDRIDFNAGIGITGHSLGGVTAYDVCHHDDRFTCGINIDGLLAGNYEGLVMKKPFCQISCEENTLLETRSMLNTEAPAYWEVFKNMKHHGFCDMKFYVPVKAVTGKMDPMMLHEYQSRIHLGFFDMYLKNTGDDSFLIDDGNVMRYDKR